MSSSLAHRGSKYHKSPTLVSSMKPGFPSGMTTPEKKREQYTHIKTTPSPASNSPNSINPTLQNNNLSQGAIRLHNREEFPSIHESPTPKPRAEAMVSRNHRNKTIGSSLPVAGDKSLAELVTFKTKARKKHTKWAPLDISAIGTDNANTSEVDESGSQSSRRGSMNPTAARFGSRSQPPRITFPSTVHLSNPHRDESKAIDCCEEKDINIGSTLPDRSIGLSARHSQGYFFGLHTSAYEDQESATRFYQAHDNYLNPTAGNTGGEGSSLNCHQEAQGFEHYGHGTWTPSTSFTNVNADPDSTLRFTEFSLHRSVPTLFDDIPDVSAQISYPSLYYSTEPSEIVIDQAMARLGQTNAPKHILKPGEDAFDSLEWDPELPTATSVDNSPEPVPIKPQPVAYTTVGSLVNPNVVPQFSAPNRIQREGANRRPLMTLLGSSRQYESILQPRGPPPPLSMANSMHYAQQIAARSPVHINAPLSTALSRSPGSTPLPDKLTRQEEAILLRHFPLKELQERSGNVMAGEGSPNASKKHSSSVAAPSQSLFIVEQLIEEEAHARSNSAPGLVQGLEKMQTLQRLAKFDNPMQQVAQSRLSEFSIQKLQTTGKAIGNPNSMIVQEMLLQSQPGMSTKSSIVDSKEGELDRTYKFPPPGFSMANQANPLATNYSTTLLQTTSASASASRPGYPEPLTAGPPGGQRQYNQPPNMLPTNYQELWSAEYASQSYKSYGTAAASSPWSNSCANQSPTQPSFFQAHSGHANSKVVDTVDPNAAAAYYGTGWPGDMTGHFQPISDENARHMVEGPYHLLPKAVRDARRDERTTDLWYNGQRRYNHMEPNDYQKELKDLEDYVETRQGLLPFQQFGAIGPPKKKTLPPVEPKPFTEEEIKKKPIPELVPPALESGWGTLVGYSAGSLPGTNSDLSRLVAFSEAYIDADVDGNKSLFGEDWGKPPKGSADVAGWER